MQRKDGKRTKLGRGSDSATYMRLELPLASPHILYRRSCISLLQWRMNSVGPIVNVWGNFNCSDFARDVVNMISNFESKLSASSELFRQLELRTLNYLENSVGYIYNMYTYICTYIYFCFKVLHKIQICNLYFNYALHENLSM